MSKLIIPILLLIGGTCHGGSFEYPLTTSTSVASSDFVRVVTATGVSENITKANFVTSLTGTNNGNCLVMNTGQAIQGLYTENTSFVSSTTQLASSYSLPYMTLGTQILSITMTPLRGDSFIRIKTTGRATTQSWCHFTTLLYRNTSSTPICARCVEAFNSAQIEVELQEASGGATARTYSVWVGPDDAQTWSINGFPAGVAYFGGISRVTMTVEELSP